MKVWNDQEYFRRKDDKMFSVPFSLALSSLTTSNPRFFEGLESGKGASQESKPPEKAKAATKKEIAFRTMSTQQSSGFMPELVTSGRKRLSCL